MLSAAKRQWTIKQQSNLALTLQEWRNLLPQVCRWDDDDPPAKDINAARLRGKYYGALNVIHRPCLQRAIHLPALQWSTETRTKQSESPVPIEGVYRAGYSPGDRRPVTRAQITEREREQIISGCRICVKAVMRSTTAFDGVMGLADGSKDPNRLIVTNIFGTAHA